MFGTTDNFDTIAAVATGGAVSAIGVIRLSGAMAIEIADSVFTPRSGKRLFNCADRTLTLGVVHGADGQPLDHCLCTVSRAPNSYTGENTAELHCHGSPTVLRLTLESLFLKGARQALPGEFTKRAFLNGCMDLTQAEAVIDLIESETGEAARNAAAQLGGAILQKTDTIYVDLVDIISHYHAVLDYPDEEIEDFRIESYTAALEKARRELRALLDSFARGLVMKDGVKAAIIGRPNVGKSSLLNALLGFDRAIVTAIPGTTRDTLEESVVLGGVRLRLSDTAGLRRTDDPVESLGVDRSLRAAAESALVLAVFDGTEPLTEADVKTLAAAKDAPCAIAVVNKCDLPQVLNSSVLEAAFTSVVAVSALDGAGLEALARTVSSLFPLPLVPAGEVLTNTRHVDAVGRALASVDAALTAICACTTPDIILTEAENALCALGELTGRTVRDDVTQRIFERFCVGK